MKRKKKTEKSSNLGIAFLFVTLVFSLLIISILFKLISLIEKSKFDGKHSFNVSIQRNNSDFAVVSFLPENKSMSFLKVTPDNSSSLKDLQEKKIGRILGIPLDGNIKFNKPATAGNKDPKKEMQAALLNYKNIETDLNIVDIVRLWMYSRGISSYLINVKEVKTGLEQGTIDKISSSLFNDLTLSSERKSIEIINGTEVPGLGNRLARVIGNIGGNVVAVSTSDRLLYKSEILYFGEKNYTTDRVKKVLGINVISTEKSGISDITVKVGKDMLPDLPF